MVMVCGYQGLICIFDQHDMEHSNLDAINHLGGLGAQIIIIHINLFFSAMGGKEVKERVGFYNIMA